MTTNNIKATVNGVTFEGLTIEQAQALASMATATAEVKAETVKASKTKTAKKANGGELTKTQVRVINGVLDRANKKGICLGYYVQGSWVWFYDKPKAKAENTAPKATKSPELHLIGSLSTKATTVKWSKARGQFFIKDLVK